MHFEVAEVFEKPVSNLSVPRIIPQRSYGAASRDTTIHAQRLRLQVKIVFSLTSPAKSYRTLRMIEFLRNLLKRVCDFISL